jgi:D-serine deaminase-like pyridoxal phosphate-dependent protein
LYEEVGVIEGPSTALDEIGAGERLSLIPNHSCTPTVQYPAFVMLRADGTTETFTIDARDH